MCAILFVRCQAQNEVCLPIEENPFVANPAFVDFDRSIHVLDCFYVLGESGISDSKLHRQPQLIYGGMLLSN